jgi:hypothetical protein
MLEPVALGAALAGAVETGELGVASLVLPDPVVDPAVLAVAVPVPDAVPVVEPVAGLAAGAPAVGAEAVVGLLTPEDDAGEGVVLAAPVALLDGAAVVVALGVGLAAVAGVDAAAEVAPYRPGSLPSGLDTVSCLTATADKSFE